MSKFLAAVKLQLSRAERAKNDSDITKAKLTRLEDLTRMCCSRTREPDPEVYIADRIRTLRDTDKIDAGIVCFTEIAEQFANHAVAHGLLCAPPSICCCREGV